MTHINKTMCLLAAIATLALFSTSTVASAQSVEDKVDAPPVDRELLQRFHQNSGYKVGLEIRDRAAAEGRPFDGLVQQAFERPVLGATELYRGRNVLVIHDDDGAIRRAGFGGQSAWQSITSEVFQLYPDQFDMVMALLTWNDNSAAGYYLPLANQIRGIGYQHSSGRQTFNTTGSPALDGLIFMNNYRTYLGQNAVYGRIVFLQEIGHRWGAFVWYSSGTSVRDDMLGRDDSHWNYFMETQSSAIEGNAWRDNSNGAFTTQTDAFELTFSNLDLYLMGFLPATEVNPWFLIENPDVGSIRDDTGRTLNPASPPAFFRNVTVPGERKDISIEDVIDAEGTRNPSFQSSQREWRVATVLIVDRNDSFGESDLRVVEGLLDDWEELFEEECRGEADLIFTLEEGGISPGSAEYGEPCEDASDCNPDTATACLEVDDGQICSHRCVESESCGDGFCCGEGFCFPTTDSACEGINNAGNNGANNGGANNGDNNGANNGDNNSANNGANNGDANNGDANNGDANNGDPFLENNNDPFLEGGGDEDESSSSGRGSDSGCAVSSPSPASAPTILSVLGVLVGLLVIRRRR